jgi:hypothetical protein
MTKLVVVLAVVVIVILVIVIIAARSMRAEDPDEFADRGPSRGGRDDRDDGYERQDRHPARTGGGARAPQRQGGGTGRMAAGSGRGFDDRRDQQRSRRYDERVEDDRGYDADRGFERSAARGYSERRGPQTGPQERARGSARRADGRPPRRPEESPEPARARPARSRRSGDSSEWDSSEWEKLSDVDYWAELTAAGKPLTTTAQPAAQARPGPDRDTEAPKRRTGPPPAPPRQDPETGLPVRGGGRPQPAGADLPVAAAGRDDFTPAPVALNGFGDQTRPVPAPLAEPRSSRHADPSSLPTLPGQGRTQPGGRPRVDPDDDPLTSPSFPRIPAADSRSYRNGRADTPARGSSVPAPYLAQTQQFGSYGSPAPDYPGNGSFPGNGSRDTDATPPNGYDPLSSRDPYPAQASPPPARPSAPAAPAASGNPYGSYVTPDSQATVSGYREYSGAHSRPADNDPGSYLPPARPSETPQPSGNGYWPGQPPAAGAIPGSSTEGYLDGRGQYPDPLGAGGQRSDYGNGYGNGYAAHDPAGYPPGSYPAGQSDQAAGHAPLDPYGRDGYGYPGYGPTGR